MSSSSDLQPVSPATRAELHDHRAAITAHAVAQFDTIDMMGARSPEDRHARIRAGIDMTGRMLESLVTLGSAPLVDDQASWSISHLPKEGIPLASLVMGLRAYREAVVAVLSDRAAREITPYVDRLIRTIEGQQTDGTGDPS